MYKLLLALLAIKSASSDDVPPLVCGGIESNCNLNNVELDPTATSYQITAKNATAVVYFECSGCQFTFLPAVCDTLPNLRGIKVDANQIGRLESLKSCKDLIKLDLSENNLTNFDGAILGSVEKLKDLHLAGNQIKSITEKDFKGFTNLNELRLDANTLAEIAENAFQGLVNLKHLDLSDNELAQIPQELFKGLVKLKYLSLSNNQLSTLPGEIFHELKGLRELKLQDNQFVAFPENLLNGLGQLEIVHLGGNPTTYIPSVLFKDLDNLTSLKVDDCRLFHLNYKQIVEYCPKMVRLDFDGNNLRCEEVEALVKFFEAKKIDTYQERNVNLKPWQNFGNDTFTHENKSFICFPVEIWIEKLENEVFE